ncbi:MAG: hypothetical protein ACLP0H_20210 [Terriglobales bacterium]
MPKAPQCRKKFKVSDSLNRQLNTYAQVAAAAGVSVLALAGASEAEVVYTETHQVTHAGFPLYLDLNHDGINDFMLRETYYAGSSGVEVGLDAGGIADNRVAGRRLQTSGGYFFSAASALHAGARIGPEGHFSVRFPTMAEEFFPRLGGQYSDLGPWVGKGHGVKNRYLGLKFIVDGEVHYGWARLSVTLAHNRQSDDVNGTLTGYAYETVADKPIIAGRITGPDVIAVQPETGQIMPPPLVAPAPAPATLGLLAKGALTLDLWRRD